MADKNNESFAGFRQDLPNGRSVALTYRTEDPSDGCILFFSKRLIPEEFGKYRSLADRNRNIKTNFSYSNNRRSLITTLDLSLEAAYAVADLINHFDENVIEGLEDKTQEGDSIK